MIGASGDLLLHNAHIHTLDARNPRAEAVVIRDGRVDQAGKWEQVRGFAKDLPALDLGGRTVLPGFIDSHVHFTWTGMKELALDLLDCERVEDVQDLISQASRGRAPGGLIFGMGINHYRFPGRQLPTAANLDAAAPDHPVFLVGVTGHYALTNSPGAELLNMAEETPGFGVDGLLTDRANTIAGRRMRARFAEEQGFERLHRAAADKAITMGLTTVHALDGSDDPEDPTVRELVAIAPHLPLDLVVWDQTTNIQAARELGLPRIGGCVLLDGDFGPHTAALLEPYADQPETSGTLYYSQEEIDYFVGQAHREGMQVAMHAVGDRAAKQALDAYERALLEYPREDHRHRIEHFSIFDEHLASRAKDLGVHLAIQPPFNTYFGGHERLYDILGEERARRADPVRSLVDMGISVGGGSDSTVTPLNPIYGVHCAVNHSLLDERLSVERALQLYTIDNAKLGFEEEQKGSIEVGKRGDMVVLDADPLEVPPAEIEHIGVELTIYGGRIVYSALEGV